MISETMFSTQYTSFWRIATPGMESLIRRINSGLYTRDFEPMTIDTPPERRGIINEIAFRYFCNFVKSTASSSGESQHNLLHQAKLEIARETTGLEFDINTETNPFEDCDIFEQFNRFRSKFLDNFFISELVCRPNFKGCGIIDACTGDIIFNSTLVEIKAGDRLFKSADMRQILTYLSLNYAHFSYDINTVGLFNPRVGTSFLIDCRDLCYQVSGRDVSGLVNQILAAISSGEISR